MFYSNEIVVSTSEGEGEHGLEAVVVVGDAAHVDSASVDVLKSALDAG